MIPNPTFTLSSGNGDLPKLTLISKDGAQAEIYLHGAQASSWIPAGGQERLFLSQASRFIANTPICGGIPVVFPQFGRAGPLPLHGLVRLMPWEFAGTVHTGTQTSATFRLRDTQDSRRLWAHAFLAELRVAIGGDQLAVTLGVTNTDNQPFTFTAALHTYLAVTDLATTRLEGLSQQRYCDAAADWVETRQMVADIRFGNEVNRIYWDSPDETRLVDLDQSTRIQSSGFSDTVVWNPAAAKCATLTGLAADDYQRFVCVEAAIIGKPVCLLPGGYWHGMQKLMT